MARSKPEPDGIAKTGIAKTGHATGRDEDDVAGHMLTGRGGGDDIAKTGIAKTGIAKTGIAKTGIARGDGDDVEGHMLTGRGGDDIAKVGIAKTGIAKTGIARGDGDDVEGHSMLINPGISRDLSRAHEADIQRAVRAREQESEAKRPFMKKK